MGRTLFKGILCGYDTIPFDLIAISTWRQYEVVFLGQAIKKHNFVHPMTTPGEADLSADVDFSLLKDACKDLGIFQDKTYGS